jgi:hypothetical protein
MKFCQAKIIRFKISTYYFSFILIIMNSKLKKILFWIIVILSLAGSVIAEIQRQTTIENSKKYELPEDYLFE